MDALKVDRERQTNRTSIMRITGWTEQELEEKVQAIARELMDIIGR